MRTEYFPDIAKDGVSLGALTLETNDEMYASFHSQNGIDDTFSWGGKNLNKYMLVIKPANSGYFYDFTDLKKGEKGLNKLSSIIDRHMNYHQGSL